jgi:hypothetical protein
MELRGNLEKERVEEKEGRNGKFGMEIGELKESLRKRNGEYQRRRGTILDVSIGPEKGGSFRKKNCERMAV